MKVLVAKNNDCCGTHSVENEGVSAQLVMIDECNVCNPTQSDFVGLEDGAALGEAVVMERPDLDYESYELILRAALQKKAAKGFSDQILLDAMAGDMACELFELIAYCEPGTVISRLFGQYDVVYR